MLSIVSYVWVISVYRMFSAVHLSPINHPQRTHKNEMMNISYINGSKIIVTDKRTSLQDGSFVPRFFCTTTDAAFNRLEAFRLQSQVPTADVTASYMSVWCRGGGGVRVAQHFVKRGARFIWRGNSEWWGMVWRFDSDSEIWKNRLSFRVNSLRTEWVESILSICKIIQSNWDKTILIA